MTIFRQSQGFDDSSGGFQPVATNELKFDAYPAQATVGHGSSFSPMGSSIQQVESGDDDIPCSAGFSVESGASRMQRDANDRGGGKTALLIVGGLLIFVIVLLFIGD